MGAYDEIVSRLSSSERAQKNTLNGWRKNLISPRGSIMNGKLSETMDVTSRANYRSRYGFILDDDEDLDNQEEELTTQLGRLYMRKANSNTADYGFIFNKSGTQQAIKDIQLNEGELRIYDRYSDNLYFADEKKRSAWEKASNKRALIARNIEYMMRKTDVQYRTHGDRLHYFVLGKIIADVRNNYVVERQVFPLFLFSCYGDKNQIKRNLALNVEQTGFINFSVDQNLLDDRIKKTIGSTEVVLDSEIVMKLNTLQETIPKANYLNIENIEIDPTFSMIGIVTGFETEYLDNAWEDILA